MAIGLLLALTYSVLFLFVTQYSGLIGPPDWWYPVLGQGNLSAIAWLQLMNSLAVMFVALPLSIALVSTRREKWFRWALFPMILTPIAFAVHVVLGLVQSPFSVPLSPWWAGSTVLDMVKNGLLFLLVTWLVAKTVRSNKSLHKPPDISVMRLPGTAGAPDTRVRGLKR
jgi:hypothetical protein